MKLSTTYFTNCDTLLLQSKREMSAKKKYTTNSLTKDWCFCLQHVNVLLKLTTLYIIISVFPFTTENLKNKHKKSVNEKFAQMTMFLSATFSVCSAAANEIYCCF